MFACTSNTSAGSSSPRGALALRRAGDVAQRACVEHVRTEFLADLIAIQSIGPQLDEMPARSDVGRLEMAGDRLGDLPRVDRPVGELDGAVAVLLRRPDLGDDAWPGLDDGNRHDPVVLVENLGHAELLAQDAI